MYDHIITLISKEANTNRHATPVENESDRRDVFCELTSISMKESYEALAVGKHPEIKAIIADSIDYNNERYAELNGKEYMVTRTYKKGISIELTLERVN